MSSVDAILAVSNSVMAIGALLILWQIREGKKQALTSFEDSLDREYRDIIHHLPVKAILGECLDKAQAEKHLDEFFAYVDLCNQQVFLRMRKRIGKSTWRFWSDGMRSNLCRPAFKQAWELIKEKSATDFTELRRLESRDFKDDPAKWQSE